MGFLGVIFGYPLGFVMWFIYSIVKNYGVSIILFTLFTKLVLFPLSIKQQKGTARMQAMNPKLAKIRTKYANNKEKLNEEMMKLYAEENYNPASGCLPLLIQFPILFGIIEVVYKPLSYILRISGDTIKTATELVTKDNGFSEAILKNLKGRSELALMQAVEAKPELFNADLVDQIQRFDNSFLGLNLNDTPTIAWPIILIPILSGLFNLILTIYTQYKSRKNNPDMPSMGAMNVMLYVMPVFSVWFAFQFPIGVGIYWIFSSVFSLIQTLILYKIYTPERVAVMLEKDKEKRKHGKKKKRRPSMMERYQQMLEEQQAAAGGKAPSRIVNKDGDSKISNKAQKELNRQIIAEARKRYAEKYGDEYIDEE